MVFLYFLSNLHAVAEGEADAAVGADRHMIQQFSPGFRIEIPSPSAAGRNGCREVFGWSVS